MAAKSYSNYTPDDILALGIATRYSPLFGAIKNTVPSDFLLQTLADNLGLPLATEKAKSEHIITPILKEIRRNNIDKLTYFSGYSLNVDAKRGLKGRCDFILSLKPYSINIEAPLFCMVEAKNEAPDDANAMAQCIAEMYAARLFNEKRKNEHLQIIYGAVTNGYEWIFLKLEDNTAFINQERHTIVNLAQLLGTLQHIVDMF